MSIEDNDNLYILEEEDNDESPKNFAQYTDEERIEDDSDNRETTTSSKSAFATLLYIMFNPVEGWKALRRSNISLEKLQSSCFYPLLAILAISKFAEYFYSVNISLYTLVSDAVIAFVAYFFGFFCIQLIISWFIPKELKEKFDSKYGKQYIVIGLSTLALFNIITDVLPMLWPILTFLPIWTLYLMFKGVRFFKFPLNKEMSFFVVSGVATIGVPLLIEWGLNAVLPY